MNKKLSAAATFLVGLSASAHQQAPHDWLRARAQPRQLEVRSGPFGIHPCYNDKGRVVGWQGQADLVIEGRDFARIGQVQVTVSGSIQLR